MPSGQTHLKVGLLTSTALACAAGVNIEDMPIVWAAAVVGSLLPDADHKHSLIGSVVPLWLIWKHRGFTHSFYALLLSTLFIYRWTGGLFAFYVAFGYAMHIFLDSFTARGSIRKIAKAYYKRLRKWKI